MPAECPSIRIDTHFGFLPRAHVSQLRLFEIRRYPHVLQRHHHQQSLPRLHDLSRLHLLVRRHSVHRRNHVRVTQVQLRCVQGRARLRYFRHFRLRVRRAHAYLFSIRQRTFYSRPHLQHARLRRVQLRLHDFHIPLRLSQLFLVCLQSARSRICVCFRCVVLLLRNFVSFHQRLVPRQIRLRQCGVRHALVHVCLRKCQVRCLRQFVSCLRASHVRLRPQQLRVRAGSPARYVFRRPRHVDSRGPCFAFSQVQRRLGLIHGSLVIARIDLHQ